MYVSRAVRAIRDDPVEGERIRLVVETDEDTDAETVARSIESIGGTVERRLQFEDLEVAVPQERVDAVCVIDGLVAVQTADAIGINPDEAEEDLDSTE